MATKVVTVDRDQKPGVTPILRGLWITLANMVRSLFLRQASTVQFPEQKRPVSSRFARSTRPVPSNHKTFARRRQRPTKRKTSPVTMSWPHSVTSAPKV